MGTSYSRIATSLRLWVQINGFDRSLYNYIRRLPIRLPLNAKILDIGCGTGILGISIKKLFPKSNILATDIEEKFLDKIQEDIIKLNFPSSEFNVGIADINSPENVLILDTRTNLYLKPETFDVVLFSATIGYSIDPIQSIKRLSKLVKIGGYLIDIEMSENIIGRTLCNFYRYKHPGITNIIKILNKNGYITEKIPFLLTEIPAGLSRTGIIARKSSII